MTTEKGVLDLAWPAGEDLSNDQYRFVVLTSAGTVRRPDSETEVGLGILQNAPASGEAANVRLLGASKMVANAALGIGTFVMPEYVSATDAGKGKTSAGAPAYTRAQVIESTGAEDDLASVLLTSPFPGINDAVAHVTTVTTDTTGGANTWSAAEMIGGLLLRDPAGANRSDVTATAAQIVAAIAGAIVGSSFEFTIKNTADANETITLTAGAGVTLTGTMTIRRGYTKRFLAVCTNVTAAAEAVTIYELTETPNTVDRRNDTIADPGNAGAIAVTESGVCAMTSAGAETRTIAAPAFMGQTISLIDDTHVGNIVVTAATTVNQTGNNTLTFGAVADACTLTAMTVGGSLVWRVTYNDGVALSTV
jgi:hypothetical protein